VHIKPLIGAQPVKGIILADVEKLLEVLGRLADAADRVADDTGSLVLSLAGEDFCQAIFNLNEFVYTP